MEYNKPVLNINQQIELLKSRGLQIDNNQFATDILTHINYFRLKAYFIPFYKDKDIFIKGTSLKDIVNLYLFDSELKNILSYHLSNIEIELRTNITNSLVNKYNDSFCYMNKNIFDYEYLDNYQNWLDSIKQEIDRNDKEPFIKHFKNKYTSETLTPLWILTEVISFGSLSVFYKFLNAKDKKIIALKYNIHQSVLSTWLHSLTYIRNIIAHYGRFWNKDLSIKPKSPFKNTSFIDSKGDLIDNSKIFIIVCIIEYLNKFIKLPKCKKSFRKELKNLFKKYKITSKQLQDMGFNSDWLNFNIWNQLK